MPRHTVGEVRDARPAGRGGRHRQGIVFLALDGGWVYGRGRPRCRRRHNPRMIRGVLRNRELAKSQIGGPLVHIAAGVIVEAQRPATFEWLAAELLDEDRSARRSAFRDDRPRPFEMIRPRSAT